MSDPARHIIIVLTSSFLGVLLRTLFVVLLATACAKAPPAPAPVEAASTLAETQDSANWIVTVSRHGGDFCSVQVYNGYQSWRCGELKWRDATVPFDEKLNALRSRVSWDALVSTPDAEGPRSTYTYTAGAYEVEAVVEESARSEDLAAFDLVFWKVISEQQATPVPVDADAP